MENGTGKWTKSKLSLLSRHLFLDPTACGAEENCCTWTELSQLATSWNRRNMPAEELLSWLMTCSNVQSVNPSFLGRFQLVWSCSGVYIRSSLSSSVHSSPQATYPRGESPKHVVGNFLQHSATRKLSPRWFNFAITRRPIKHTVSFNSLCRTNHSRPKNFGPSLTKHLAKVCLSRLKP